MDRKMYRQVVPNYKYAQNGVDLASQSGSKVGKLFSQKWGLGHSLTTHSKMIIRP